MLYSRPMLLPLYWLQQQQQQQFNGSLSGTTRVGRYQKKHSPDHTHPGQRTSFITFLHLKRSMASSLFSLHAWQSSRTTSFQVLFGLLLKAIHKCSKQVLGFEDPVGPCRWLWFWLWPWRSRPWQSCLWYLASMILMNKYFAALKLKVLALVLNVEGLPWFWLHLWCHFIQNACDENNSQLTFPTGSLSALNGLWCSICMF